MDNISPEERSAVISRVRSIDTAPELVVRELVFSMGFLYRLHRRDLPGTPDLVLPERKKISFVHVCYWHGHACSLGRMPKSRVDFWTDKIAGNKRRDSRNARALRKLGWRVIELWECELHHMDRLETKIWRFLDAKR